MTELLLDVGNSRCKYACMENRLIKRHGAFDMKDLAETFSFTKQYHPVIDRSYMISVASRSTNSSIVREIKKYLGHTPILLDEKMPVCGIRSDYQAKQLGIDRITAMVAAWQRLKQACLVIDCGTAITIDCLDDEGIHKGGVILPSSKLMRGSLSKHTAQLDYFSDNQAAGIFATDTEAAIASGCHLMLVAGVANIVHTMRKQFDRDIPVIASGGGADLLEDITLFNKINVSPINNLEIIPELNFEGMAALIEEYHVQ